MLQLAVGLVQEAKSLCPGQRVDYHFGSGLRSRIGSTVPLSLLSCVQVDRCSMIIFPLSFLIFNIT